MAASIWTPGSVLVDSSPAVAPFQFVVGTVAAPGICFVGFTGSGLWSEGSGSVDVAVAGVAAAKFNGSGLTLPTGKKLITAAEIDLVAAATTDIGSVASNSVRITGGGTITSFGTTYRGPMFVRLGASTTFTNSATLLCPGGASFTAKATDTLVVTPKATAGTHDGWAIISHDMGLTIEASTVLAAAAAFGASSVVGTYTLRVENTFDENIASFYQANAAIDGRVFFDVSGAVGQAYIARECAANGSAFQLVTTGVAPIELWTNSTRSVTVDGTTGNIGVNTAAAVTSVAMLGTVPNLTLERAANYGGFAAYVYSATTGQGPMLVFGRSNSNTKNILTQTISGNALGYIAAEGVNTSSAFRTAGYVAFNQDAAAGTEIPTKFSVWLATAATGASERFRFDSSGNALVLGIGALGYATGTGGAVTQITSRVTGVTLNKTNGAITLFSAAGSATWQSFTVTNNTVIATDTIVLSQKSGTDLHLLAVTAVGAGSFRISFATTGGTTVEQPVFNFAVIRAAAS